jgi:Protein of unknown function (DUF1236)
MRPFFRCAAAIVVLAGTAAANAQTTIIERDSPSVVTRERVDLSPAQRTIIYRSATHGRVRTAPPPGVEVRLGARVPRSVELYEMPTTIVEEVPTIRRYRYMVVNDEVVLVDPATSEVVEVIRR